MPSSLSRVQLTRGARSVTVDAPSSRRWVAAITGEAGEATVTLPRGSMANDSAYIDYDGGSLVRIISEGGCGAWSGIVTGIDDSDPHVLALTAHQPAILLGKRVISGQSPLVNVTAGMCATRVLQAALDGVRGLSLVHTPFEGGVLSGSTFDLNGNAWSMLTALMDASDGELHITEGGEVRWIGALAGGSRYDPLLVAGGNFQEVQYRTTITDRVSEVMRGEGADQYTARSGDAARSGWPGQLSIDGTAQAAQQELEARSASTVVIAGGVTSAHWSIRERDTVAVLVPNAGGGGRTHRCRVLGRSLADGEHLMKLELQVVRAVAPTTVVSAGAGGRMRPAQRASADALSGSLAQRFGVLFRGRPASQVT